MDFSHLPEPLRRKLEDRLAQLPDGYRQVLEARLAKLPADRLEAAVAKSSPLLDRLEDRLGAAGMPGASAAPAPAPASGKAEVRSPIQGSMSKGHYNTTVQRGDPPMPSVLTMLVLLGGLAFLAWRLGWLPA